MDSSYQRRFHNLTQEEAEEWFRILEEHHHFLRKQLKATREMMYLLAKEFGLSSTIDMEEPLI